MRAAARGRGVRALALAALAALAAVACATGLAAQSSLRTEVDTTLVHVGDPITMTVTVDHPAGSRVVWPDSVAVAPFEVLEASAGETVSAQQGALRSTATIRLTAFELGELEIPGFDVEVVGPGGAADTLSTDVYGVLVVSVGGDDTGDIRDIRGPMAIALSVVRTGLWALGAIAVLAVGWVLWRRMRRRGAAADEAPARRAPARPPHEVALEALAELEASPLLERGEVKAYHIRASEIVRAYVEARFEVPALEMTTWEVLDGLARAGLDADVRDALRRFLDPCDLVKFAKVRPDAAASRGVLADGRAFVQETAPGVAVGEDVAATGIAAGSARRNVSADASPRAGEDA
jgi:hypothetical protein